VFLAGCGKQATSDGSVPQSPPGAPSAPSVPAADRHAPLVIFLGDSLTAGHGLAAKESFPAQIESMLATEGRPVRIVNAGVSGDTSAGGLRRLDWLLAQKPTVLVVELGANDGLRGASPQETERNLREIVTHAKGQGVRVLLLGMKLPPNYGQEYLRGFEEIYPALARELHVPLVPFLLEGVAGDPALNLEDGIHPSSEGQVRVAKNLLPYLRELLR
jgi:acyl-CoA thioesterase-1